MTLTEARDFIAARAWSERLLADTLDAIAADAERDPASAARALRDKAKHHRRNAERLELDPRAAEALTR